MKRLIRVTLVATCMIAGSALSALATVPGNPFLIDGIVKDDNNSGLTGTYTVPPCDAPSTQACKQVDGTGNDQELGPLNSSTTKIGVIHNAHIKTSGKVGPVNCTVAAPCYINMMGTTNPNAQVDLNTSWIQSAIANVGGVPHIFLYFGWKRDSNSGSGFISLEIQKAAAGGARDNCNYDAGAAFNPDNCNPWAGRQNGDVIFLWDQSGSSTAILAAGITGPSVPPSQLGLNAVTLNIPDCSHSGDCAELTVANVAQAEFGTDCGFANSAGYCGEMVVDLTALGVFSANPTRCESIANIIPGTVTGNSNSADYKDVVLAPFPSISNCGTLTVTKRTLDPAGTNVLIAPSAIFGYTAARAAGNVRFDVDAALHTEDGPVSQSSLVRPNAFPAGGAGQPGLTQCTSATATPCGPVITHIDLISAANYTLVESTPPVPWVKVSIVCKTGSDTPVTLATNSSTFEVRANTTTACVITNKLQLGSPTGASRQTVTIADQIKIVGLTAGGASNTGAGVLARNIARLFLYEGGCGAAATSTQFFDFTLTFSTPSGGTQDAYMSGNSSPNLTEAITAAGTTNRYWAFRWDGDTFNNPITVAQTCTSPAESVSVTISSPQATIP